MGFQLIRPLVPFKKPEAVRCRIHQNKENGWKDTRLALAARASRKAISEWLSILAKSWFVSLSSILTPSVSATYFKSTRTLFPRTLMVVLSTHAREGRAQVIRFESPR